VLTLVGAIDLPIIKILGRLVDTLHQGASVFRVGGSTIYPTILLPLFIMPAHSLCCLSRWYWRHAQ